MRGHDIDVKYSVVDVLENYSRTLSKGEGLYVLGDITKSMRKSAVESFKISKEVNLSDIVLLIDNLYSDEGTQGLLLTSKKLFSYSEIAGRLSMKYDEITNISPQTRFSFKTPISGILINKKHFISLPGMLQEVDFKGTQIPLISIIVTILNLFCVKCEGVEYTKEPDPGPPPWFVNSPKKKKAKTRTRPQSKTRASDSPSRSYRGVGMLSYCSVGVGGWGLRKCNSIASKICPRCYKPVCSIHISNREIYRGEYVCEPCARGMSDDTA